jgi:hypothetical protein
MVASGERFDLAQQDLVLCEGQLADARLILAGAIGTLQRARRGCQAEATLALTDFDTSGLTNTEVAADVIAESRLLHGRLQARIREGDEVPHAAQHLAPLAAAIGAAEAALAAVYAADSAAQQARDERHTAAVRLDDRLIAFRRIVRAVLGSAHRDYRRLRARTGRGALEDELEPAATAEPPPRAEPQPAGVPDASDLPPPATEDAA